MVIYKTIAQPLRVLMEGLVSSVGHPTEAAFSWSQELVLGDFNLNEDKFEESIKSISMATVRGVRYAHPLEDGMYLCSVKTQQVLDSGKHLLNIVIIHFEIKDGVLIEDVHSENMF